MNFFLEVPGKKEAFHFFICGSIKQISPVENKEYMGKTVEITKEIANLLTYSSIEFHCESLKQKAELVSLAVDQLVVRFSDAQKEIKNCTFRLNFRDTTIIIPGTISRVEKQDASYSKLQAHIQFNPELVELLDNYFFKTKIKKS